VKPLPRDTERVFVPTESDIFHSGRILIFLFTIIWAFRHDFSLTRSGVRLSRNKVFHIMHVASAMAMLVEAVPDTSISSSGEVEMTW
jgi:hypothetical protein